MAFTKKQYIDSNGTKSCPTCGSIQYYITYKQWWRANSTNSKCNECNKSVQVGIQRSEETKRKISELTKSGVCGMLGRKHSKSTKQIMSKNGGKSKGRNITESHKQAIRIATIKKLEEYGIGPAVDKGANQFFDKLNSFGFNFKPKRFWDIGYDSDGYDEKNHMWVEFDTPYHNSVGRMEKDMIRQNNIISHFENIGKPLTSFLRVSADKNGNPLSVKMVYPKE